MRTRIVRLIAGLVAGLAGIVGVTAFTSSTASAAATPNVNCVTRAEYRRITRGLSPNQVARRVGTIGKVSSSGSFGGYRYVHRHYRTCTVNYGVRGFVSVYFDSDARTGRNSVGVDSKAVYW